MIRSLLTTLILVAYLPITFGLGTDVRPVPERDQQSAVCQSIGCACAAEPGEHKICCCRGKEANIPTNISLLTASICDSGTLPDVLFSPAGFKAHFPAITYLDNRSSGSTKLDRSPLHHPTKGHKLLPEKIPL
jgi:hypothetical protein